MEIENNPFIQGTDYFKEYNESIQKLKNDPKALELDRLCYEALEINPSGKALIKVLDERFLIPGLANPGTPTFQIDLIFSEGIKAAFRILKNAVAAHAQRIHSENKPQ